MLYGFAMTKQDAERSIAIFSKSVYRDLKQNGYSRADIVAFASNILELITNDAKQRATDPRDGAIESQL